MNRNTMTGKWDELKGKIKQKWGDLTEDEVAMAEGRRDEFIGKIKQKYGEAEDNVRRQMDEWERDWDSSRRD